MRLESSCLKPQILRSAQDDSAFMEHGGERRGDSMQIMKMVKKLDFESPLLSPKLIPNIVSSRA